MCIICALWILLIDMLQFLKKITSHFFASLIGSILGLLLGPFAAIGKSLALSQEEFGGCDHFAHDDEGVSIGATFLIGAPITMLVGAFYGLYKGFKFGINHQLSDILTLPKKLFSFRSYASDAELEETLMQRLENNKSLKGKYFVDYQTHPSYLAILNAIKAKKYKESPIPTQFITGALTGLLENQLETLQSIERSESAPKQSAIPCLPPEIIHHIAKKLDCKTIIQSGILLNPKVSSYAHAFEEEARKKFFSHRSF